MDKVRILKILSKQFIAQEKYEEAIKCLEAATTAVDALPVERAIACVQLAIVVLEHFEEVDYARTKLLQAVRNSIIHTCNLSISIHIIRTDLFTLSRFVFPVGKGAGCNSNDTATGDLVC